MEAFCALVGLIQALFGSFAHYFPVVHFWAVSEPISDRFALNSSGSGLWALRGTGPSLLSVVGRAYGKSQGPVRPACFFVQNRNWKNIFRGFTTFSDFPNIFSLFPVSKHFQIFHTFSDFPSIFMSFPTFPDCSKHFQMFSNIFRFVRTWLNFPSIFIFFQTFSYFGAGVTYGPVGPYAY